LIHHPRLLSLYTSAVSVAGFAILAAILVFGYSPGLPVTEVAFWLFVAAVVAGEFAPIRVPGHSTELAISTTFTFALMLAYGPETAILVQAFSSLAPDVRNGKPLQRSLFNVAQYTLAWSACGAVVMTLIPAEENARFAAQHLPALALAVGVFFVVNSLLVRTAVALSQEISLVDHFTRDFAFRAWTTGMLMALAPGIVAVQSIDPVLAILIVLPVGAIHRAARELARNEHLVTHDSLTGMPNRVLFQQCVGQAVTTAQRSGAHFAVLMIDLDRFKDINDTLGHHQGDLLLKEIRPRLEAVVGGDAMAARLGGDEFGVLLSLTSADADEAAQAAARIRIAICQGIEIDGVMLDVGASIGVAVAPTHGDSVEMLLKAADIAMYRAKDAGSGVEVYEPIDDQHTVRRLAMARELRLGLERGELLLHYQPKLDLATGEIRDVEALVRWEHPERGMVPPDDFVPLAEHAGLILGLTTFVLTEALDQVKRWRAEGLDLTVAVNLSARSLLDGALPDDISDLLAERGLEPACLTLEITENAIMSDPLRAQRILERLREMGVRLAVDDFGTGHSSLAYLKRLPVDEVKIDRSFVMNMAADPDDALIVRSTVELARGLGREVVAEGVEDAESLERLRSFGCHIAQGYHISRPLPADELAHFVQDPGFSATLAPPAGALPFGSSVARVA